MRRNNTVKIYNYIILITTLIALPVDRALSQVAPDQLNFVRQGVQRMIFNEDQSILLASLEPDRIIGLSSMHPVTHFGNSQADVMVRDGKLVIQSQGETQTGVWFGGFNPFATYSIDLDSLSGDGEVGFEFSDDAGKEQFYVKMGFNDSILKTVKLKVVKRSEIIVDKSIAVNPDEKKRMRGKIILQMLGSGLTLFLQDQGKPQVIGQSDFNTDIDLRKKEYLQSFQSHFFANTHGGYIQINKIEMALTTGLGLSDIRAITYENGEPMLDEGRLWYTMSIRGRALPHHIQGVFSMDPTVFDPKLEGIILFDRDDGLLRNEIASHIFYDRKHDIWRGITTGFSAFANPEKEEKQLLAVESKKDPRFGFSIMNAAPFGVVGDIEDPHILLDSSANKWRILASENKSGYKAVMLQSDQWNRGYTKIAGPVEHNSTGTSIQKIGDTRYCFAGSSERKIFIYTYPDLKEAGSLSMDLPPWDNTSGTRVWPNIVQLPDGYPFEYVALMMDRFDYPGLQGPHWSYGALYLYHGYD